MGGEGGSGKGKSGRGEGGSNEKGSNGGENGASRRMGGEGGGSEGAGGDGGGGDGGGEEGGGNSLSSPIDIEEGGGAIRCSAVSPAARASDTVPLPPLHTKGGLAYPVLTIHPAALRAKWRGASTQAPVATREERGCDGPRPQAASLEPTIADTLPIKTRRRPRDKHGVTYACPRDAAEGPRPARRSSDRGRSVHSHNVMALGCSVRISAKR